MLKQDLIDLAIAEITASGSLPFSPPTAEIERIINMEAEWFFREYRDANYVEYYILNKKYYLTQEWRDTRTFQLPDCVLGIRECREITGGSRVFGINDPDLNFDRLMAADLYLTPLSSDQMAYRTIQWSFWDMSRSFNLTDIRHSFNINTHRLKITGREPSNSLIIFTTNKIPLEDLYDDTIFQRWVIAKAKISLARILGTFNYQLVGGVTINFQDIKSEGNETLTELKEYIKGNNTADYFVMFS